MRADRKWIDWCRTLTSDGISIINIPDVEQDKVPNLTGDELWRLFVAWDSALDGIPLFTEESFRFSRNRSVLEEEIRRRLDNCRGDE